GLVAPFGHLSRRPGGVARDHRLELVAADDIAALAERVDVAVDGLQVFDPRARGGEQLEMDRQEGLADDVQARGGQERMNVGDATGDRVLDRDHAEIGGALLKRCEGVLEGRAGNRRQVGKVVGAGNMRIGPGLALVDDQTRFAHQFFLCASMARARSSSSGVSTPSGATSTTATSIRMSASSALSCSRRSRRSSGEGGRLTKRQSASRRYA